MNLGGGTQPYQNVTWRKKVRAGGADALTFLIPWLGLLLAEPTGSQRTGCIRLKNSGRVNGNYKADLCIKVQSSIQYLLII